MKWVLMSSLVATHFVLAISVVWLYSEKSSLNELLSERIREVADLKFLEGQLEKNNKNESQLPNLISSFDHSKECASIDELLAELEYIDNEDDLEINQVTKNEVTNSGDIYYLEQVVDESETRSEQEIALAFMRHHGYDLDYYTDPDKDNVDAVMDNVFFSIGSGDLRSKLDSVQQMANLDQAPDYLSENIITSLVQEAISSAEDGAEIMEAVYRVGAHPAQLNYLLTLTDSKDERVSELATLTVLDLINDFDHKANDNDDWVNQTISHQVRAKAAEKIASNPKLMFRMD
jgi:anion-transporting  ArsA/GET3 family ATPase